MNPSQYVKRNRGKITWTKLKAYDFCPLRYYLEYEQELKTEAEPSEAMVLGSILDDYVSMSESKFWEQWELVKRRKDKTCQLTQKQFDDIQPTIDELKRQPLYEWNKKYKKQFTVEAEYRGLQLRGTLDRFSAKKKLIRDLKRTREIVSKNGFECFLADVDLYFYDRQLSYYWLLIKISEGIECKCIIDAVDKTKNCVYQAYELSPQRIKQSINEIMPILNRLVESKANNIWEPAEDRKKCMGCPIYSVCTQTPLQQEITTI